AYTAGTTAGVVRLVDRWLAYGTMPTLLQDYITEQSGVVDSRLEVQTITPSTTVATTVGEGIIKPEVVRNHLTRLSTTLKVGITELITSEVESYLMRHAGFQEALELDLLVKIEEAISRTIAALMLGALPAFPAATYSATVPAATWADLIALVLNHARDNNILYETRRVQSEADLVVLPLRYHTLFPMALKDTQARRLYASFGEAFARPDVRVAAHTLTTGALANTAAVAYSAEWGVAYGDGEVSVDYIPLSDGT
ncbi:MAG: hypothetical protein N3E49_09600, partial [Bacteroidia bacterium]|nr:hypothetical protein [Bacteroidia bacterium]